MNEPSAPATTPYLEIPLPTLRPGEVAPFPIYTAIQGAHVLYRANGEVLEAGHIAHVDELGLTELWVPEEFLEDYLNYLSAGLQLIVDDDQMAPSKKIENCYENGVVLTHRVLENPQQELALLTLQQFVKVLILLVDRHSFTFSGVRDVMHMAPSLSGHSVNTCVYALLLGRSIGFEPIQDLCLALLLHDMGKPALPDDIDEKEGLEKEDWSAIQQHPAVGLRRLGGGSGLSVIVRDVMQNHHERVDGSGYPRGLHGSQVTMAARIAGIVNSFDSRTTDRSYRKGRSTTEVIREMLSLEANAYDSKLVRTFVQLLAL